LRKAKLTSYFGRNPTNVANLPRGRQFSRPLCTSRSPPAPHPSFCGSWRNQWRKPLSRQSSLELAFCVSSTPIPTPLPDHSSSRHLHARRGSLPHCQSDAYSTMNSCSVIPQGLGEEEKDQAKVNWALGISQPRNSKLDSIGAASAETV